jgi:hypothetical protein
MTEVVSLPELLNDQCGSRDDLTVEATAALARGPRDGEVVERLFDGRAVRCFSSNGQRHHCLAYPCPNLTVWFYRPAHSDLCMSCIEKRESARGAA